MGPSNVSPSGSSGDIRDRLLLWCKRAESGFARVEFTDESVRQRVVAEMGPALSAANIPLHEISLPTGFEPARLVADLLRQLELLSPGVVSIDGFATALTAEPERLQSALYYFNFSRERLGKTHQRQIWWMPQHFADAFVKAVPDLDSWFLVRLRLTETATPSDFEPWIEPDQDDPWWYSSETPLPRLMPAEARKQAQQYVQRLERGLLHQVDPAELESAFLLPATTALVQAGLEGEALGLEQRYRARLTRPQHSTPAPILNQPASKESVLESAREMIRRGKQLYDSLRFNEAETEYRRALSFLEANHSVAPVLTIILSNLAQLLQSTKRLPEAEPLLRRALAIDENSYGEAHPNVARDLNNLALLLQDTNRLSEAEPLLRRALAIDAASYGAEHPNVAIRLSNLARLLQATKRLAEAEPLMRRAVEISLGFFVTTKHHHPSEASIIAHYRALLVAMNYTQEQIHGRLEEIFASFGLTLTSEF